MRLGLRLFLGFFLIVGLAAFFVMRVFVDEVKPGVRQAMESTLVDAANVLAVMAADDMKAGRIANGDFVRNLGEAQKRDLRATVWHFPKRRIDYRITITDARGIVVYDSEGKDLGRDNSRWNDVYRTLRGFGFFDSVNQHFMLKKSTCTNIFGNAGKILIQHTACT